MSTQLRGLSGTINPNIRPGMRPSASVTERIYRMILNMRGVGDIWIKVTNSGIEIGSRRSQSSAESYELDTWSYFGYRFIGSSNVLQVKARAVVFHSSSITANVPESDVLLSGAAAWVYAQVRRSTGAVTVLCGSARPASDPESFLNVVLYRFDLVGTRYILGHCGWWDTNIDLPLVKGT